MSSAGRLGHRCSGVGEPLELHKVLPLGRQLDENGPRIRVARGGKAPQFVEVTTFTRELDQLFQRIPLPCGGTDGTRRTEAVAQASAVTQAGHSQVNTAAVTARATGYRPAWCSAVGRPASAHAEKPPVRLATSVKPRSLSVAAARVAREPERQ